MNKRLDDDHPAHPSMEQVVVVKADLQQRDERIVTACEYDKGDHIRRGKSARSASQFSKAGVFVLFVVQHCAVSNVT